VIVFNKEDVDIFAKAITRLLEGVEAETAVYTWFGSGDGILPQLLDLPVDTLGLDFVSGRDNWEAIRAVDFSKKLGAGIVDGRNTRIESLEQIEEAIRRLSEVVSTDGLYVNPSCGLEYLPRETAFEKLKRMVEGAHKVEPVAA
jgi:5-methyltetrahydropteroyltriglutamate--homocysteine methyltransferase